MDRAPGFKLSYNHLLSCYHPADYREHLSSQRTLGDTNASYVQVLLSRKAGKENGGILVGAGAMQVAENRALRSPASSGVTMPTWCSAATNY